MIHEAEYREHFSGLCAPLAKTLHQRHGWSIWLISSYYAGVRGERHVCISPEKGGLLDALGWDPDFSLGYHERCRAQLVVDDPGIERISLEELECLMASKTLGGANEQQMMRLNEVADEIERRYAKGEAGAFRTFDPSRSA